VFLACDIRTLVVRTVRPSLQTLTMLSVSHPVTTVSSAVRVAVVAETMGFAIQPVTEVDVTA